MNDRGELEHRELLRGIVQYLIKDCRVCHGAGRIHTLRRPDGSFETADCHHCWPVRVLLDPVKQK